MMLLSLLKCPILNYLFHLNHTKKHNEHKVKDEKKKHLKIQEKIFLKKREVF